MRIRGLLLLPVLFLSGCAVFRPPKLYSPRSTEAQNLLFEATAAACARSTFVPRDADEDQLVKALGNYQLQRQNLKGNESPNYVRELDYNIVTLKSKLAQLRTARAIINAYEGPKFYLDVQIDQNKKKIFQYMLENAVKACGIELVANEKEANFKIVVNVFQADLRYSKNSYFLYSDTVTKAVVALDTHLVENKTKTAFFKGGSKCSAYQKQYQVLGVGPFNYQKVVK